MNHSTAVMLINEDIRVVRTVYETLTHSPHQNKVLFKTLDKSIEVGDLVVVPTNTRHEQTVVKVIEVDCDVDFDSDVQVAWVTSKVDLKPAEEILDEEAKWIETLKASEIKRKRKELRADLIDLHGGEDIAGMAIARRTGVTMIGAGVTPPAGHCDTEDADTVPF